MDNFIENHVLTWDHLPFIAAMLVLAFIGRYMSMRVWTRARAYTKSKLQPFWWHMRETQILHPFVAGALVGLVWNDPEGHGWDWRYGVSYFVVAGGVSLFFWLATKIWAKRKGVQLVLPGESKPPDA
jgi:hypothetical protein